MSFLIEDLEGIRKVFNIKKLNILAHSWGTVVAAHYALNYPTHIKKIVFSNPAMLSREYDEEAATISKKKTTHEDSVKRAELMGSGPMDINKYEAFFIMSFQSSAYDRKNLNALNLNLPENFSDANKALFGGLTKDPAQTMNLYDDLRSIKAPTLIIHGEADIIPLRSINRLKGSLPNSQLVVFSKSGHFPFIEETERFNKVVKAFLSGN
jgi:proline iminopeptidase